MDMRMFTSELSAGLFGQIDTVLFYPFLRISAHSGESKKVIWKEEEEEELRRLFMENQANPETDEGKC